MDCVDPGLKGLAELSPRNLLKAYYFVKKQPNLFNAEISSVSSAMMSVFSFSRQQCCLNSLYPPIFPPSASTR